MTKAVSRSVSLPKNLWETVEGHAPNTPGRDRSGYIRLLVEEDLKAAGKLTNGAEERALADALREAKKAGVDVPAVLTRAARRAR